MSLIPSPPHLFLTRAPIGLERSDSPIVAFTGGNGAQRSFRPCAWLGKITARTATTYAPPLFLPYLIVIW